MFRPEEIRIRFIPSSGPGGQNANKVATTAVLSIDIEHSSSITAQVRARLLRLAGRKINQRGILTIVARRYRTQDQNRMDAIHRLETLYENALRPPILRVSTRPTGSSIQRRLRAKKAISDIKKDRSKQSREDL